jgi:hypothetical protein
MFFSSVLLVASVIFHLGAKPRFCIACLARSNSSSLLGFLTLLGVLYFVFVIFVFFLEIKDGTGAAGEVLVVSVFFFLSKTVDCVDLVVSVVVA